MMSDQEKHDNADTRRDGAAGKKRGHIKEKITGRKMTPGRVFKYLIAALLVGIVFGAGVSGAMYAAGYLGVTVEKGRLAAESYYSVSPAEEEVPPDEEETAAVESPDGTVDGNFGVTESETTPAEETIASTEASSAPEIPETENQGTDACAEEPQAESVTETLPGSDPLMLAANNVQKYLVKISRTSSSPTWFGSETIDTVTYSGIILSADESEILVLAAMEADASDTLILTFSDGVSLDAHLRKSSAADGISVLAATAEDDIVLPAASSEGADGEAASAGMYGISIRNADELAIGEAVIACGSPLIAAGSFSFSRIGYINDKESAYDRSVTAVYTDTAAKADLGTFLIDTEGKLIGIASEDAGPEVPASYARFICMDSLAGTLDALIKGEGTAFTGIKAIEVNSEMLALGVPSGCSVTDVAAGSPAYTAGIKRGDIITGVNGNELSDMDTYEELISGLKPGDTAKLSVKRSSGSDYRELSFSVTVGER